MAFRLASGIAFLLILSAANAADLAQYGPNATAAALMTARGRLEEPALELVYKVEGKEPGTITVDLADDFSTVQEGSRLFIYDFALRRIITLDDTAHSFENGSMYALVEFSFAETYNRRMQRSVLSAAKLTDRVQLFDPFWVQSQLHVMLPEDPAPMIDRRVDTDGSVHFSYGGKEVASYLPSPHAMTKEEGARLARFLRFYAPVHPVIVEDIVASGRLPQRLSFERVSTSKVPPTAWTLQSAVAVKAVFPLRAGDKVQPPRFEGAASSLTGLAPAMQAAIAGQAPGKRTVERYRAEIEAALAAGKAFQAVLTALEMSEQYGTQALDCVTAQGCHALKDLVAAGQSDPRTQSLLGALRDPHKGDAVKALQALRRDDLTNAYLLDEFLANDLVAENRSGEALPLFTGAIKGNPYIAGFYKDLGDGFRFNFDPQTAWYFYDLGRTLPGGPDAPVIAEVNRYESGLAKRFPEFF